MRVYYDHDGGVHVQVLNRGGQVCHANLGLRRLTAEWLSDPAIEYSW
ncbi:hypothetical protein Lalb_Chr06g0164841 [Lupinus albus]|uniref:Uncharacterized protein n=1 Tax=Lupinus albus TaxID=3870 RepID=A0A6A4QDI1_LUPAL|nr:hypothetical protein Lalb_Chr06g0164841 [Lupinus albus]